MAQPFIVHSLSVVAEPSRCSSVFMRDALTPGECVLDAASLLLTFFLLLQSPVGAAASSCTSQINTGRVCICCCLCMSLQSPVDAAVSSCAWQVDTGRVYTWPSLSLFTFFLLLQSPVYHVTPGASHCSLSLRCCRAQSMQRRLHAR